MLTKEDCKILIPIATTLVCALLSSGLVIPAFQIAFILVFVAASYLTFSYFNKKTKRKLAFIVIAFCVEFLIMINSIADIGSVSGYFMRIKDFFVKPDSAQQNAVISDANLRAYYNSLNEQLAKINDDVEDIDYNINTLTNNLQEFSFNEQINDAEINKVLEKINTYDETENDFFVNLKSDPYLVEIFYKTYISRTPFNYCNIVEAFNDYGIDTEKLDIDESVLIVWDVQRLYAIYNMKKSIAGDLDSDEIIEEKRFYYNDYKVNSSNYSDTLDYGEWKKTFTKKTAKDIDEQLHNIIMDYYKKFMINFSLE